MGIRNARVPVFLWQAIMAAMPNRDRISDSIELTVAMASGCSLPYRSY